MRRVLWSVELSERLPGRRFLKIVPPATITIIRVVITGRIKEAITFLIKEAIMGPIGAVIILPTTGLLAGVITGAEVTDR